MGSTTGICIGIILGEVPFFMEFLQVVENVLRVLERLFELIIQFGDAWSAPLVAIVVACVVLKFRSTIIGVFGRYGV